MLTDIFGYDHCNDCGLLLQFDQSPEPFMTWGLTIHTLFAWWIVFRGGAEALEDSASASILFHPLASILTASLIRIYWSTFWSQHILAATLSA